jgi:WD40 repeat protein
MEKIVRELVRPEKSARVIEREDGAHVLEINGQIEAVEHPSDGQHVIHLSQLEISATGTVVWLAEQQAKGESIDAAFLYIDGKKWQSPATYLRPSKVFLAPITGRIAISYWSGEEHSLYVDGKRCHFTGEDMNFRFSPDGKRWAATFCGMGYYGLVIDGKKVMSLEHPHDWPISLPIFSPDGISWATAAVTSTNGKYDDWTMNLKINGKAAGPIRLADFQNSRFSDDGQFFYYITGGKKVELTVSEL